MVRPRLHSYASSSDSVDKEKELNIDTRPAALSRGRSLTSVVKRARMTVGPPKSCAASLHECGGPRTAPLPFSPEDDGVPIFCKWWSSCPLNHDNRLLNDNAWCFKFGNIGLKGFDDRRGLFWNIMAVLTVICMALTAYGCTAMARNDAAVMATHWASAHGSSPAEAGGRLDVSVYIGLQRMVLVETLVGNATTTTTRQHYDYEMDLRRAWLGFSMQHGALSEDVSDVDTCEGMLEHACEACREAAASMQVCALLGCVTLLCSLLGTMNRKKSVSDSNCQKVIGMITDTGGAYALSQAMLNFRFECIRSMPSVVDGTALTYTTGPGAYCYLVAAVVAMSRAVLHWLTPAPGAGVGLCRWKLPELIVSSSPWLWRIDMANLGHFRGQVQFRDDDGVVVSEQPGPRAAEPGEDDLPSPYVAPGAARNTWFGFRTNRAAPHHQHFPTTPDAGDSASDDERSPGRLEHVSISMASGGAGSSSPPAALELAAAGATPVEAGAESCSPRRRAMEMGFERAAIENERRSSDGSGSEGGSRSGSGSAGEIELDL